MGSHIPGSQQTEPEDTLDTLAVPFLTPSIITDTTAVDTIDVNPDSPTSPKTLTSLKEDLQHTVKKMSRETSIEIENNDQTDKKDSSLSSPFAFTAINLRRLFDPLKEENNKDINITDFPLLKNYGGIDGLIKGLHSDPQVGLSDETTSLEPITFEEATGNSSQGDGIIEGEQDNVQIKIIGEIPVEGSPFYQRIKCFGVNVFEKKKLKSIFQLMWIAMQEKVLILLTIAAIVSLGLGLYEDFGPASNNPDEPKIRWVEGVAIIIAILIVVLVGSLNDWQKERQFQKLNAKKEDRDVKVIRNGKESLLSVHKILVGDVLLLEPGDIVAVDGVVISCHNLHCEESAVTGESDAKRKMTYKDCLKEHEKGGEGAITKTDPFIISGSEVLEGVGTYLVTCVGENSFYGRILIKSKKEDKDTPLQSQLNDLAEKIAKLGGAAALLMFIVLIIKYFISFRDGTPSATDALERLIRIIISTVTIVVVAVPEGLPLAVTLALAYATIRMLADNNLVRVLSACETMGNATTICSDKTGTLTQNRMTVVAGTIGLSVSFVRNIEAHQFTNNALLKNSISLKQLNSTLPEDILNLLNESIAINSTAFEDEAQDGKRTFIGSKTETALLEFLLDLNLDNIKSLRDNAKPNIVQLFPFNSKRKAMGVVVKINDKKWRFYVKGASEVLLNKSGAIVNLVKSGDDIATYLTQDHREKVDNIIKGYASQSLRTIGLAYRDFEQWPPKGMDSNAENEISYEGLLDKITLLGIMGIEDPLREGVRDAVKRCIKAGVTVRMVTGDNVLTAKSIAKQCGIYTNGEVMEGPVFRGLTDEQMVKVLPRLQVLARSSPEDKEKLVFCLKNKLREVVAVTGDGTNDGPALNESDVGFSMGIAGTEIAKEASDIILMDDDFSSIIKAIMWGRNVNDAVKKFLQFQLTVNVTAVALTFISAVKDPNQKSVLTAVQLLWVNLIMDTFAALALATDPPTESLLDRKPEPRNSPLISLEMWKMIIGQSIFQLIITLVLFFAGADILDLADDGFTLQTIVFNTFVFLQIFNEINCRRLGNKLNVLKGALSNKFLVMIFFIMVGGQVLIIQFGSRAFQVSPNGLGIIHWVICIGLGFLSIPVGTIIRLIPIPIESKLEVVPIPPTEEVEWNEAIMQVKSQLKIFKQLRGGRIRAHLGDMNRKEKSESRSKAIAAATIMPSLVYASVGADWAQMKAGEKTNQIISQHNDEASGSNVRNSSTASRNRNDANVDTIEIQKDS